jgi:hypothetical protein
MNMWHQYEGVSKILKKYWSIYGGLPSLLCSPYVHFSILITVVTSHYWYNYSWWTQAISILPNLIGFTLGGFAVFLGFGSDKFKELIAGQTGSDSSPYLSISVTFLHFVLIQLFALMWAIIASAVHFTPPSWIGCFANYLLSLLNPISDAFGYFFFIYSLTSAIAAALAVFRMASIFDSYVTSERKKISESSKKTP